MKQRERFTERSKEKIDIINAEIESLEAHALHMSGELKRSLDRDIDEIKQLRDELDNKFTKLGKDTADARDDLREGVELAWISLTESLYSAVERYK